MNAGRKYYSTTLDSSMLKFYVRPHPDPSVLGGISSIRSLIPFANIRIDTCVSLTYPPLERWQLPSDGTLPDDGYGEGRNALYTSTPLCCDSTDIGQQRRAMFAPET